MINKNVIITNVFKKIKKLDIKNINFEKDMLYSNEYLLVGKFQYKSLIMFSYLTKYIKYDISPKFLISDISYFIRNYIYRKEKL